MITTYKPPTDWAGAMERAAEKRVRTAKLDARHYAVASESYRPGEAHVVSISEDGRQYDCRFLDGEECPAQKHGRICWHKGAVARRLLREHHGIQYPAPVAALAGAAPAAAVKEELESVIVESRSTSRHQLFRAS